MRRNASHRRAAGDRCLPKFGAGTGIAEKELVAGHPSSLRVARAEGPGAGRFLAAALTDALEGGGELLGVSASTERPDVGQRGIDFVFTAHPEEEEEVIRVGLDRHGHVLSAELLRRQRGLRVWHSSAPGDLLTALRSGNAVTELRWDGGGDTPGAPISTLVVTMRSDRNFRVPLDGRG